MPQPSASAPIAGDPQISVKLGKFEGLVNTLDLECVRPEQFVRAVNIDLDDNGQIHRRRGYTQVASGWFHSLFESENGVIYGVCNGALSIINPDYSIVPLQAGIGSDYMSGGLGLGYTQIGDKIYFTSATNSGVIDTVAQSVSQWGPSQDIWLSPVVNPTATLPAIRGRLLGSPPLASFITNYNGRIYLGSGATVWATELHLYNLVDKTKNYFQFEGDITMIGTVGDGVYVGTTEGVWFLAGPSFPLRRTRVMDSPVIPRSMVYIPAELANPPQVGIAADTEVVVSIMFMTTRGICVAMDGGKAYNFTESKFFFPVAKRAAAFFRRQDGMNQYIVVADSEGQPVSGARIGDYVDAVIVRGKTQWAEITEGMQISTTAGALKLVYTPP